MVGPPVAFHVAKDAKPVQLTTPAPVPLHWQEKVRQDLDRDVNLGVLERVPYGEPTNGVSEWSSEGNTMEALEEPYTFHH